MSALIGALLALAAALLCAPGGGGRRRLARPRNPERRASGFRLAIRCLPALPVAGLLAGPLPALAGALAAGTAVVLLCGVRHRRRAAAALGAVLAGLDVMIAELTVGAHPAAACAEAGRETAPHRVSSVYAEMSRRARLGGDVPAGIRARCPGDAAWERLAVAWECAVGRGLPMADLLDATRADLAARSRYAERTHAALAGARATSAVLTALPVLGVGFGELVGAAPVHTLLRTPLGSLLLLLGTVLTCAGALWTRGIVERAAKR